MRVPSLKVFVTLIIIVSVAVVSGSFLYTKFNQPQKPQDKVQNQTLLPSSPPVVCKRFTNLGESLKNIEIACVLDLSNQNLTTVPNDITKLTKLNELNLSNNKFTSIPASVLDVSTLITLNLSNNQISKAPQNLGKLTNLQSLNLSENNFSENEKNRIITIFPPSKF